MGYNTTFKGTLTFVHDVTAKQIAALQKMFGEDCREHPEWGAKHMTYIDLRLNEDMSGIEWDDATEKTYDLTEKVNLVIRVMREKWPEFALSGVLLAQGEDITDRWKMVVTEHGGAAKVEVQVVGQKVTCPHCDGEFIVEMEE